MTARDYGGEGRYDAPAGAGWVLFAAIMLGVGGMWNFLAGIMAIGSAHIYVGNANFVFSDLSTWGWIIMILGIFQLLAAFAIYAGREWARWFGIACASVNAIGQLMFINAQPWWAITMFALDVLVIYALAAYGGSRLEIT